MTDSVQIIRDTAGNAAFAVLSMAEYERLVDAADEAIGLRAFDDFMANYPETFPEEIADQLVEDKNPVRLFREYRGLTQRQLGELTGIIEEDIALIETGSRSATFEELARIAVGLRIDPGLLM